LVSGLISQIVLTKISQKMSFSMRTKISQKINKIPLGYFDKHQIGDTLIVITNDVDTLGQSLSQIISSLFRSVVQIIGVIIAMFTCS
jgi:ATP-binding cassette subfamily B protein